MPIDQLLNNNPAAQAAQQGGATNSSASPGPTGPNDYQVQAGGPAGEILKVARDIAAMHEARQQTGLKNIQTALQLKQQGFPVDPKLLVKSIKQSKIPIDTSQEGLTQFLNAQGVQTPMQQAADRASSSHAAAAMQAQGQQPQPQGQPQKPDFSKMSKEQQKDYVATQWANQALAAAAKRGESQQRQAELADQVTLLKQQAISDDKDVSRVAVGKLMAINEIPFNLEKAEWMQATPEQKASIIDIAAGHESQAQQAQRAQGITNSLISSGKLTDPALAQKAGTILAAGGDLPDAVKSAMKPYTFNELAEQATLGGQLIQLGVPADRLKSTMAAAAAGGLENALPTGITPIVMQQLALQREQLGLEAKRVEIEGKTAEAQLGIEGTRLALEIQSAELAGKKMDIAAAKEANAEVFNQFRSLVELKKSGAVIPEDLYRAAETKIAEASGLKTSEVKHWYQYVTGGSELKFTPRASKVGKSMAGPSQTSPSPTVIQSLTRGAKKAYRAVTSDGSPN